MSKLTLDYYRGGRGGGGGERGCGGKRNAFTAVREERTTLPYHPCKHAHTQLSKTVGCVGVCEILAWLLLQPSD